MEIGSPMSALAMFGTHMPLRRTGVLTQWATGSTPGRMAGIGTPLSHLPGLSITMAVGDTISTMAGIGFLATPGRRLGCVGATVMSMWAGRPRHRSRLSVTEAMAVTSATMATTCMERVDNPTSTLIYLRPVLDSPSVATTSMITGSRGITRPVPMHLMPITGLLFALGISCRQ